MNGEWFNVYQGRIGSSVTQLKLYVSKMRNLVICYFIFKNQSHYSGICGQRAKNIYRKSGNFQHQKILSMGVLPKIKINEIYFMAKIVN